MSDLVQMNYAETTRSKLLGKKSFYEGKLQSINNALALLDKNPEIEQLVDACKDALSNSDY